MVNLRIFLGACAALLGMAALGASLLAHGGRWSEQLDVASHFAPLYLLASMAVLAAGFVVTSGWLRVAVVLIGGLGLVSSGALMAPEIFCPPEPPVDGTEEPNFTVIQFNAWGRNKSGDQAVRWILSQSPDAVIVEEASQITDKLLKQGYHASCLSCGVTVFTRKAPTWTDPTDKYRTNHPYLTASAVEDSVGEIVIVGVHRAWPTRFAQSRIDREDLARFLEGRPQSRIILAGDFNSTPWSFARQREDRRYELIRRTRRLPTWPAAQVSHNRLPAPFPYLPIDHVYAGPGWATVKVERGPRLGSDHYPVIVTLAPLAPWDR